MLISFIAISFLIHSQKSRKKFADKMFYTMMYNDAAQAYEDVLERTNDSLLVLPNIGRSYQKLGQTEKSVQWFDFMNKNGVIQPSDLLQLAFMKRELSDYTGFNNLLNEYVDTYGENEYINAILSQQKDFEKLDSKNNHFTIKPINTSQEFSFLSINYSTNDSIFISSTKNEFSYIKRIDGWTGEAYYTVGSASINKQDSLSKINVIQFSNNEFLNKSSLCIDANNEFVYFTANYSKNKKSKINTLKIFRGKLRNNKVYEIESLSFNDNSYSCAYPSISNDGKTLYFSSNMPGGYGGMDLYAVQIENNQIINQPVNLGSLINSPRNEITPHIKSEDKRLFFSSNGHLGFGGYDVFVAHLSLQDSVTKIENLGHSINSNKDEISFINNKNQTKGFLISNRDNRDKPFILEQSYSYSPKIIKGYITDNDGNLLPKVQMTFFGKHKDTVFFTVSNDSGYYEAQIENNIDKAQIKINENNNYKENIINIDFTNNLKVIEKNISLINNTNLKFSGIITDKENSSPINDVSVKFIDLNNKEKNKQTFSEEQGSFSINYENIESINTVKLQIVIEKQGYVTKTIKLDNFNNHRSIALNDKFDLSLEKSTNQSDNLHDIIALGKILFDFDKHSLIPKYKDELYKVAMYMEENPNTRIVIKAHTDTRGPKKYNDRLSLLRARSCLNYLLDHGIDNSRLSISAMGETSPLHSNEVIEKQVTTVAKEKMHAENRRVQFQILE